MTAPRKVLISDGGTHVHYLARDLKVGISRLRPLCHVDGWKGKEWRLDDGFGAILCGRCEARFDAYLEQRRQQILAQKRERYHRNIEEERARQEERRQDPKYRKVAAIKAKHRRAKKFLREQEGREVA